MRSEGMIASSVKNTGAVARLAMSGTLERRAQRVRQAAARMTAGGATVGSKKSISTSFTPVIPCVPS